MNPLMNIPGLGGYLGAQQIGQQQQMGQLTQMNSLVQLQQLFTQREAKEREMAKERQFRSAIAEAKTTEEQLSVASKFMGPDALGRMLQGSQDRQAQIAATREATKARLQQAAQQFDSNWQLRMKAATTQDERLTLERERAAFTQQLQSEAARLAGAQANYNFGFMPSAPITPTVQSPAPAGQTVQGTFGDVSVNLQNASPALMAVARAQPEAQRFQELMVALGGAPAAPTQAPVAPQPAPQAPQPAVPNNMDARDLGAWARGPVMPPQAPVPNQTAPTQMPPEIAAAPRRVQDQWRLKQASGDASSKASDAVVNAIAEGRMPLPSGFALRSPYWQDVVERVAKIDPKFDAGVYGARASARRTFASGPEARNVTAMNTLIGHLGTLDEAAQALENKDLRAANAVINRARTELGDPRIVSFETAKEAVANEAMRVFRQVGASSKDSEEFRKKIVSSSSPAQLRASISTIGDLLEKRIEAIGQQYERTVTGNGNPSVVDPKNLRVLDTLRNGKSNDGWSIRPK